MSNFFGIDFTDIELPLNISSQIFNVENDIFSGVYMITNKQNGESYIGRSNNVLRRFSEHKAKRNTTNTDLGKAFRKYGIHWFEFMVLELVDDDNDIFEKEKYWIGLTNPTYNMNAGGHGNSREVSEEVKKRISLKNKEYWKNLPESKKQKIIKRLVGPRKGYKVSEETKKKLRQANLGKKQSRELIDKRMKNMRGRPKDNSMNHKKIDAIKNGVVIKTFESVKKAAEYFKMHPSNISKVLNGSQKTAKGYNWKLNLNK